MTPHAAPGLLDMAETAEIATLLAAVMPHARADRPCREEQAVPPTVAVPEAVAAVTPAAPSADPGPLPAPFGVLPLADFFALVNWHNRPDAVKPLPLIRAAEPPPPPGHEWTVGAVLSQFGWE
jgi:hypothetical protein